MIKKSFAVVAALLLMSSSLNANSIEIPAVDEICLEIAVNWADSQQELYGYTDQERDAILAETYTECLEW